MKMKKMLAMMIVGSLMSIVTGCGDSNDSNDKDVKEIAIVQYMEHGSLDTIRENLIEELKADGYVDGENIIIDYQNSQGDQSNLNSIAGKFKGSRPDVIIAIATPAAQSMAAAITDIPIIFSAVSDPLGAKLVTDMDSPAGNITGTSDILPMGETFEFIKELTPDAKKIGFIYTSSEPNSQSIIAEAKEMAADYGLTYEEKTITTSTELQQAAHALAGDVDIIYTPVDNTIANAIPVLAEVGKTTKVPVYVGADSMVRQGGYASVSVDYARLGEITGDMVIEVLEGKPVSEIPVRGLDEFAKVINKTTAEIVGAPGELEGAEIVE